MTKLVIFSLIEDSIRAIESVIIRGMIVLLTRTEFRGRKNEFWRDVLLPRSCSGLQDNSHVLS